MTKLYLFTAQSTGNVFKASIAIEANSLVQAQDKFLDWLKKQPVYQHMWNLTFECKELDFYLKGEK